MLTQKEKNIVNACIDHWTVNAKNKFFAGRKAFTGNPPKWDNGSIINCTYKTCPMCQEYVLKDGNCDKCLFKTLLNTRCDKAGGLEFAKNPCLETCNNFMLNFERMLGT